ncbi:MAG: hypothetical protein IJW37_07485 [Lachnospiraceae bacterium]|nr:hypothetical protein [Lachnospiraceae bacterium]
MVYYDKDGTKDSMYSSFFDSETRENAEIYNMQEVFLENYPYEEVWQVPGASYTWTVEEIVIKIK